MFLSDLDSVRSPIDGECNPWAFSEQHSHRVVARAKSCSKCVETAQCWMETPLPALRVSVSKWLFRRIGRSSYGYQGLLPTSDSQSP